MATALTPVNSSGHWIYNLNNSSAAVQGLNAGQMLTDTFTVKTADGTAQVVSITINGTNDAAIISGTASGSVVEAGGVGNAIAGTPTATGTLTNRSTIRPIPSRWSRPGRQALAATAPLG